MTSLFRTKVISFAIASILLSIPFFAYAETPTNPAGSPSKVPTGITYDCANERGDTKYGECTFADVINAVKRIVNYVVEFALMFSVIVIAVAGGRYMMSGGNPSERAKANEMLLKVVKGTVIIIAAWMIVNLITTALLRSGVITFGITK